MPGNQLLFTGVGMLRFRLAFLSAAIAAVAVSLTGCGHGSKAGLPPVNSPAHTTGAVRPTVVYAAVQSVPDEEAAQMEADRASGTTAYLASVKTLNAIVTQPAGATYDADDGNYYVVAQNPNGFNQSEILRINKTGATSTLATLSNQAVGIAYVHANHTFYVTGTSSSYEPAIFAVTKLGAVSTVAGGTTNGHTDGTGSAASFTTPTGITLDGADGALYIVDGDRVRRMTTAGAVTTLTPASSLGISGSYYGTSGGIVWDKTDHNFYVADSNGDVIRRVTAAGAVKTLAGECVTGGYFFGCAYLQRDGKGSQALFAGPTGIAADPTDGSLYVADYGNNEIRHVTLTGVVTTFAGNGLNQDVDGAGMRAQLNGPKQMTLGPNGLFVTEVGQATQFSGVRTVTITGTVPPPLTSRVALINTARPAAPLNTIDWHKTATISPTLWYTETDGHYAGLTTSGLSTEYSVGSSSLGDVVLGTDGTPWIYNSGSNQIINRKADGSVATYSLPGYGYFSTYPDDMALAPSGNIWLSVGTQFDEVTPTGTVTSVAQSNGSSSIAFDGSGDLWAASYNSIIEYSSSGTVLKSYYYPAQHLTTGTDGNIWFTQGDAVGKIDITTGIFTVYPLVTPVPGCTATYGCSRGVATITAGPDGAYWFVEQGPGMIGRITPAGAFTEYQIYDAHRHPFDLAPGPDGNIWFTDTGAEKIGKVNLKGL